MSEDQIKKFWLNVTAYYQKAVPNEVIAMYAYDCRDITIEELRRAFEVYRNTSEGKFFPVPAALKVIARPPIDDDAEAHAAVARIQACLSPFKNANDAREHMGELAWEVVRAMGGWNWFGQNPPPNSFVQRDMFEKAKAFLTRARQGRTDVAPSLGGSNRPQIAGVASQAGQEQRVTVPSLVSDALKGKSLN